MFRWRSCNFYNLLKLYKTYARAQGFSPKTIRSTEVNLKMIGKFIALEKPVRKFTENHYENFLIAIRESDYSPETMYDLNATLRKMINFALRRRILRKNPLTKALNFSLISRPNCRVISARDFLKIRRYFQERENKEYELLVLVLYYTGLRIGEALALEAKDFWSAGGKTLRVDKSYLYDFKLTKTPKNKKCREVPLPKEVYKKFKEFSRVNGKIFRVSPSAVNVALRTASNALGIERVHCHLFRHTYISNLIRAGVPLPVVASVSGDTQKTILMRYSHMVESDKKLVLRAMEKV